MSGGAAEPRAGREAVGANTSPIFFANGSYSRQPFLAPTGRFAAGAGRRVTDRRARGAAMPFSGSQSV